MNSITDYIIKVWLTQGPVWFVWIGSSLLLNWLPSRADQILYPEDIKNTQVHT